MTAYKFERELARTDACNILLNAAPIEILRDADGNVAGLKFVRTRIASDGKIADIPNSEWIEPCDQILLAIGQIKQQNLLHKLFPDLVLDAKGRVEVDPLTGATSLPMVFSGGDCANGGKEVVNAVGEGKKAALAIHRMLTGKNPTLPVQHSRHGVNGQPAGSGLLAPVRVSER